MADRATNRRGIALMLVAMAAYALNDGLVKASAQALPPGQLLALRGVFAIAFAFTFARSAAPVAPVRLLRHPLVLVRCLLEITTALSSVLALARAPLAVVAAIMMSAPLLIGLATIFLGWEPWRGPRILVGLAGFAGVLAVLRPWSSSWDVEVAGMAWSLLCAASLAARDLVTRRLPRALPSSHLAALTTSAVCGAGLAIALFERWSSPLPLTLGGLALAAFFTAAGNLALIAACRDADLSVVTPFRYSLVVWAVALGALFWNEVPDTMGLLGIALICAAGISTARQNARR